MRVRAGGSMSVAMRVNQARPREQRQVMQDISRRPFSDNASALKNITSIRDVFKAVEIVRGGDHGLSAFTPGYEKIDDLTLALGIERGGGLIKQQHFWIENQN